MEYEWSVFLTWGDWISWSEEEAGGYWGFGLFCPQVAEIMIILQLCGWYTRAGGTYLQDRGDLLVIKTTAFSDLTDSAESSLYSLCMGGAALQSLTLAPINAARLTLLIQGLPDTLKTFVANFQDAIWDVHVQNTTDAKQQEGCVQPVDVATWTGFVQELVSYEC